MSDAQRNGVRRRSRAEIHDLARQYETSGLSRSEVCRRHGLLLSTHLKRRQEHRALTPGGEWIAVEVSASQQAGVSGTGSGLSIALSGGRRIEVERGFDARPLIQLLGLLEQR